VFCDSVDELRETVGRSRRGAPVADVVGVRVRPPEVGSRFGVDLHDDTAVTVVARTLTGLGPDVGVGLHVHVSPREVGVTRWWQLVDHVVGVAREVEERSGRPVRCLDLGGGWEAQDLLGTLLPGLPAVLATARRSLAALDEVVLEPGRAVAQPLVALVTRVLSVRPGPGAGDVVVDASIADVPEVGRTPHRWFHARPGADGASLLPAGRGRVLGRSCMETDVLATGLGLPDDVAAGDALVIMDVGAYDTSKSYPFGRGAAGWSTDGPTPTPADRPAW
jgi:diaminopimelate decarboxylase